MELHLIILFFLLTVRSYGAFLQCSYDFFLSQKIKNFIQVGCVIHWLNFY